ncbi:hypothetical protein IMCC1989_113 [gamma proteobacterium IMCC1989]|nr:hypothetical protein IMCC1989_113 [gamma proteobacterium IMCC1989]
MHSSNDIRKVKCLEALYFSYELLGYNFDSLHEMCLQIKGSEELIPALSKCWFFIDLVHRIREVSQVVPGLSKKNKELKQFLHATNIAEEYRHYIQHLRKELGKKEINNFPVWGTLSWVDKEDEMLSHLIVIGTQIKGTNYSGCVFDKKNMKWVSRVCLSANGSSFNFDPIYDACSEFHKFIMPWIHESYEPGINKIGSYPIISSKIEIESS